MKNITLQRFRYTFVLAILLGGIGCTTTDNKVGSLARDSGAADGSGPVARDVPPADTRPVSVDAPAPDVVPTKDAPASDMAIAAKDAAPPDGTVLAKDAAADLPQADAVVPDVADMTKDAAPEAGGPRQCQLSVDGTCTAVTPNTSCTPFTGRRYETSAGCYFPNATTLWCCAAAAGDSCGWPAATGCYEVATDSGPAIYWTPALGGPTPPRPGTQICDETTSAKVSSASPCRATSPDAAAPLDAHASVTLPLCSTDDDCCVTVDSCMATATLSGKAGWGEVPGAHFLPDPCVPCIPPAVDVQCQGGFCVGKRLIGSYVGVSHCGRLSDAGVPHATADAGTGPTSYQTSWGCH